MSHAFPPIGIDLGTTFSVVAHLDSLGRPSTLLNAEGDLTTPSVVFFDDSNIVVGKEAIKAGLFEPNRVAQFVKREMGNPLFSKSINGEFYPPEVIQSLVLEKLKVDAQARLGPFQEVVITVPAYFNEPRRKATQDAGRLAGLKVVDIINEPTAAAIAHGFQQGFLSDSGESKQPERVIVYDLGGGTFDVTLMSIEGKNFTVLATDGDVKLGGIDWDRRILDWIAVEFEKKLGIDPRQSPAGFQRLLREAEDAKRALSAREKVTIGFEHEGRGARLNLSRGEFEAMSADLLERTRFTVTNLLRAAGCTWADVTRVLLVGGSTRMPMVPRMLEQEAGKPVDVSLSVDEAVAHGAAIYAGLLRAAVERPRQAAKIVNVNSHSLGVLAIESATGRPRNQVLIPMNHPLPASHSKRFRTGKIGQRSVVINVIEGGDASGNHGTAVGKCIVRDLPPGLPAGTAVHVTFDYSSNGRLTVRASLPEVGREAQMDFERASGLTEAKLKEWDARIKNGFRTLDLGT